ncbi:phosphoheptose isomerase [Actinomycetes bacterium]|nr:phosphoheptose isomerase [Actinomycetes bacterium]
MGKVMIRFQELANLIPEFELQAARAISSAADVIALAFKNDKKVLICGNGGSAADSQHFAAEFVNAFSRDLDRKALPALALSTDTSILTSIANDFQFENVFSRQVEAYGQPGDILITLTTSGASKNCLVAINMAKSLGLTTIAFTRSGGQVSSLAEISIEVPSENTQHIQECHMLAYHVITELVEDNLFRKAITP